MAEVHVATWRSAYRGLLPDDFLAGLSVDDRRAMWERVIPRDDTTVLVAATGEDVIGFCAAGRPIEEDLRTSGTVQLWTLYVLESAWSTGAGRDLWLAAERELRDLGAERVVLWVLDGNERAIRFYRRAGFEFVPNGHKVLGVPGSDREELLMTKDLSSTSAPIAVISDVHGNAVALEAVIDDMRRFGVQRVFSLGDVAAMGPQPRAAVDLLRSLDPLTILGNTDDYLVRPRSLEQFPEVNDQVRFHLEIERWGAEQLGPDGLAWLRTFSPSATLEIGGCRIVLSHGSPISYDHFVAPDTLPETLDEYFAGAEADLYLGGHIHHQFSRRYRRSTIANPGSAGLALDRVDGRWDGRVEQPAVAEYALLTVEGGQPNLHFRRVPYDVEALIDAVKASDMPNPDYYLRIIRR